MLFSSPIFLFLFLPAVLIAYLLLPGVRLRNGLLLVASLLFYAWGEGVLVITLLVSIGMNYVFGLGLGALPSGAARRGVLFVAVAGNLALLGSFKYGGWLIPLVPWLARSQEPPGVHLPIGLSFFTFQALSYVIDVYRGRAAVQRSLPRLALYIALFPQLILGPIVRYRDLAPQLGQRGLKLDGFAEGVERFVVGLAKKVLVADTVAPAVNAVFALPPGQLTPGLAWLAVAGFTIQLYFDFSGYADMAIGLGRMFGFRFRENFRYPYAARSRTEYFQRWHMSFFTWLRDYLYRPLCGRHAGEVRRTAAIPLVLLAAGLWHGAAGNFIAWGAFNGAVLAVERMALRGWIAATPRPAQHAYALAVMLVSNAIFRSTDLSQAGALLGAMAGWSAGDPHVLGPVLYLDTYVLLAFCAGALGAFPVVPALRGWASARVAEQPAAAGRRFESAAAAVHWLWLAGLWAAALLVIGSGTHVPFFYFRF